MHTEGCFSVWTVHDAVTFRESYFIVRFFSPSLMSVAAVEHGAQHCGYYRCVYLCVRYEPMLLTYLYLSDTTLLPEQPKVWENTRTHTWIIEGCNTRHTHRHTDTHGNTHTKLHYQKKLQRNNQQEVHRFIYSRHIYVSRHPSSIKQPRYYVFIIELYCDACWWTPWAMLSYPASGCVFIFAIKI